MWLADDPSKVITTQEEAHRLYEGSSMDPSLAYTRLCLLYITMIVFQPLLPLGVFTGLIGLVLTYYAYKKMLLRDCKRPILMSKNVPLITISFLNTVPLCYGVILRNKISSAIFDKMLNDEVTVYSWSILVIGLFSIIFPIYLLIYDIIVCLQKKNKVQSKEQNYDEDYNRMRTLFSTEYDRANPITKSKALQEYFSFIVGS